jgi:hypothetical protein
MLQKMPDNRKLYEPDFYMKFAGTISSIRIMNVRAVSVSLPLPKDCKCRQGQHSRRWQRVVLNCHNLSCPDAILLGGWP